MKLIVRLIGAVLLILTSSLYGWLQAKELSERRGELNYLSQLIAAFKSEVSFQRSSLGEIFLKLSEKSRLPYQDIFQGIYHGMECKRKSFEHMWREALERMTAETCLKKEDIQYMMELTSLAKAIDLRYREEIFERVSGEMEEQKQHLENEYRQKGKVYCCMGITIGILGVIILI